MIDIESTTNVTIGRTPIPLTEKDWQHLGKIVQRDIKEGIEQQRQITGEPYAPLKPETAKKKARPHGVQHPGPLAIPASKVLNPVQRTAPGAKATTRIALRAVRGRMYISPTPEKRLIDSGNLLFNQKVTPMARGVDITIGPTRLRIGFFQQEQPGPGNVKTNFFGVSERAGRQILAYIDRRILEAMMR